MRRDHAESWPVAGCSTVLPALPSPATDAAAVVSGGTRTVQRLPTGPSFGSGSSSFAALRGSTGPVLSEGLVLRPVIWTHPLADTVPAQGSSPCPTVIHPYNNSISGL